MARDQALLDLADTNHIAVLRLYRWTPSCISFGRHEPARRRYDRPAITRRGLDCVRRPTGGRAVWHARELTYAVAAPLALFGSLRDAYRDIHLMLADAVRGLGAEASLAAPGARPPGVDAGACFASPVGGEVVIAGAKVLGSAQVQQGQAVLQHGSLLLEDSQAIIHDLTLGAPAAPGERPLAAVLGRAISFEEAAAAVESAARNWAAHWTPWEHESMLADRAAGHAAQFRSREWTWSR